MEVHPSRLSVGSKVSITTVAQYRYEGTVAVVNSIEGTLTLQNVHFWGKGDRTVSNAALPNRESKTPPVGSLFDSITFWMSSIIELYVNEDKSGNDLGDKGVVKAGVAVDVGRSRPRRPRSWWQSGDQPRSAIRGSPVNGVVGGIPVPMNRYGQPITPAVFPNQPRMLVSYPRRGRNPNMLSRQTNYVPVMSYIPGPGGGRRSGYWCDLRNRPYRIVPTPIPNGTQMNGRKTAIPVRTRFGRGEEDRYRTSNMNPGGGVFVYLDAEMAAAYQTHGLNIFPNRILTNRRRMIERRGASRGPESSEPDCTTPYDFETANAELEAELAKITIDPEGQTLRLTGAQPGEATAAGLSNTAPSTGEGNSGDIRSPSSVLTTGLIGTNAAGNGASGDSSHGAVTSTVLSTGNDSTSEVTTVVEGTIPLAKGEYYVREKCFFDQISRSENVPRGSFAVDPLTRGAYQQNNYIAQSNYGSSGPSLRGNFGPGISSIAAARRERQLNMETFGPMAARTTFVPRRRHLSGNMARDFLVSASA